MLLRVLYPSTAWLKQLFVVDSRKTRKNMGVLKQCMCKREDKDFAYFGFFSLK